MSSSFIKKKGSNEKKNVSSFLDLLDAVHNYPEDSKEGLTSLSTNGPSLVNILDAIHDFQDDDMDNEDEPTWDSPARDSSDSEGFLPIKKEPGKTKVIPNTKVQTRAPKIEKHDDPIETFPAFLTLKTKSIAIPSGITVKKVTNSAIQKAEPPTYIIKPFDPLSTKLEPEIEIKEEILETPELINENDFPDDIPDDSDIENEEPPKATILLSDLSRVKQKFVDLLKASLSKKCHFCDSIHETADSRLIHELEIHIDCGYMGFNAETDLQKDRIALLAFWNKRKNAETHECFFCQKNFPDKNGRYEHETIDHGVDLIENLLPHEDADCECGICGKKFTKLRLSLHFKIDHGIGTSIDLFDGKIQLQVESLDMTSLYCLYCDRKFQFNARRISHERHVHLQLYEYDDIFRKDNVTKCTVCNASSKDSMALLSHRCNNRLSFTEPVQGLVRLTKEEQKLEASESKRRQGIRCKFCFQHFHEPYKRWRHEMEKHIGVKWENFKKEEKKNRNEYTCIECGYKAEHSTGLREHQRTSHDYENYDGKSLTVIRSRAHSQMVVFLSTVEEVKKMQEIMKDETFDCVLCNKHFEHRYRRTEHQYQVHYRARWQCLVCNAVLPDRFIGRHLWDEHQLKEDVQASGAKCCSFCGKQFSSSKNAKIHEYRVHSENFADLIISCPYCDKKVIQRNDLRRHVELVHAAQSIRCPNCNTICIDSQELVNHDCDPSKACKKCNRKFSGSRSMLAHQETCTGPPPAPTPKITPAELYPCTEPGCKQVFKSLAGRVSHVKAKQAIRAKLDLPEDQPVYYKCDECGATFSRRKLLYVHTRRHRWRRGEIERKTCKLCGKRLFDITRLRTHMKTHGIAI